MFFFSDKKSDSGNIYFSVILKCIKFYKYIAKCFYLNFKPKSLACWTACTTRYLIQLIFFKFCSNIHGISMVQTYTYTNTDFEGKILFTFNEKENQRKFKWIIRCNQIIICNLGSSWWLKNISKWLLTVWCNDDDIFEKDIVLVKMGIIYIKCNFLLF